MPISETRSSSSRAGVEGGWAPLNSGLLVPNVYLPATTLIGRYKRTAGNYTSSSTSFVDIDSTNLVWTFSLARAVRIRMVCVCHVLSSGTANQQLYQDVVVDGTAQSGATGIIAHRNANDTTQRRFNGSFEFLSDVLSAGSHTVRFTYAVASGTITIIGDGTNSSGLWWVEETPYTT